MTPILFHVVGHPRPQPRPRFVPGGKGADGIYRPSRVVSTADAKAKLWRSAVEAAAVMVKSDFASGGLPGWLGGAVSVTMMFMFATPKKERWNKPKTSRGDVDNLAKGPMDVMEKVGLLPKGDARVVHLNVRKVWAKVGGMIVILAPWSDEIGIGRIEGGPEWLTA